MQKSLRYFLILLFIFPTFIFSEEKIIKGKVKDEKGEGIAYAAVGIAGTSYGTVSDEKGEYVFYLPSTSSKGDSLAVSCVGFRIKKIAVAVLKENLDVILENASVPLPEVTVRSKELKKSNPGNKREDTFMNCNFSIGDKPDQNLGSEIGRKFFFKGKKHYINKINMYCALNFDTAVFRLNIYDLAHGLPNQNLLSENIYLIVKGPKRGWNTFDLEKYNLVFDENIVVSLQWVDHSKKGKVAQMPITMPIPGSVHFYKMGSQDKWKRYNAMSTSINLEVEAE